MSCTSICIQALHIDSGPKGPLIRTVDHNSQEASTFIIAAKAGGLPPMVLVVDTEALCKFSSGMPASAAIHSITTWGRNHLPAMFVRDEGITWVCMNGSSSFHLLLLDRLGIVTWRQVKWPNERDGSLASFIRAFPIYADAFLRTLETLNTPIERLVDGA
jgi:hypothetical protein